jgi:uncharacterized paraquat-inducible protein A
MLLAWSGGSWEIEIALGPAVLMVISTGGLAAGKRESRCRFRQIAQASATAHTASTEMSDLATLPMDVRERKNDEARCSRCLKSLAHSSHDRLSSTLVRLAREPSDARNPR